ncbi:hypothetical protein ACFLUO_07180 [Chloroflexota bacterium]
MKFLKGLVLSLLSFLLFLSLSIFGIAFTINSTILNPDFVVSEVEKIDVSSLTRELVEEQIGEQLPQEVGFIKEAVYKVISEQEPWLKEQVNAAVYSGYDFLLGKSERLALVISLEPLKENLRDSILQAFIQSLPAQLSGLPQAQIDQYFDEFYQQIAGQIPSEFEVDESFVPPEIMAQIIQARQAVDYFRVGYQALIGFMVLLVLGIILINRDVKSITRGLGVTFLGYGAIEYAGIFAAKHFVPTRLPLSEIAQIPSSLQAWLLGLYADLLTPLETFSLGCLVGGVVLLAVSFIYRGRKTEEW